MKIEKEYVAREAGYVLRIKGVKGNLFYMEELFKKVL